MSTHPREVTFGGGKKVSFSKPKADDYHSPERAARRSKRRASKRAAK